VEVSLTGLLDVVEDTWNEVPLFLVPWGSGGVWSDDAQMHKKLQQLFTSDAIFTAHDTLQYTSCHNTLFKISLLFRGECLAREGSDDEVGDFVEQNLGLFHNNVSQTIHIEILDDSDSQVEELQEMRHLVTNNAIFGCYSLALVKA